MLILFGRHIHFQLEYFEGWEHKIDNTFWTGNGISSRINLGSIEGYKTILNTEYPSKKADGNNYYSKDDLTKFKNNPPNIVGYNRISNENTNFIKMERGDSEYTVAFVVFEQKNRDDYYKDLKVNNKGLVRTMIDKDRMKNLIEGSNSGFTDFYRNNLKIVESVEAFTNKNNFSNKLNNAIIENFESKIPSSSCTIHVLRSLSRVCVIQHFLVQLF
jgi:hypothetical protein